jgi:hypothetical protein
MVGSGIGGPGGNAEAILSSGARSREIGVNQQSHTVVSKEALSLCLILESSEAVRRVSYSQLSNHYTY